MVRGIDLPDMTIAVGWSLKQQNKQNQHTVVGRHRPITETPNDSYSVSLAGQW